MPSSSSTRSKASPAASPWSASRGRISATAIQIGFPNPLPDCRLLALYREDPRRKTLDAFPELLAHLRALHPIRHRYLLDGVEAVYLQGLEAIPDQNDALRFVHFVDQVYNLGVDLHLRASGVPLEEVFPETYRHGAFAKKCGRALSRLAELLG